jgi:hypothetical protein
MKRLSRVMRLVRRLMAQRDAARVKQRNAELHADALAEVLVAQREWIESRMQEDIARGMRAVAEQTRFRR